MTTAKNPQREAVGSLPPPTHALLHAAGRDRGRRAGHGDAGSRVDDGDGVAGAGGGGLVNLDAGVLVGRRVEGGRARVQREAGGDLLGLLGGRGFGRVARQRRALRGAVNGDEVNIGQQAGAELHVVLEIKGPGDLELVAEGGECCGLVELLHAAHATELLVRVLRDGQTRGSPVPAAVVVVVRRAGDGCGGVRMLAELVV